MVRGLIVFLVACGGAAPPTAVPTADPEVTAPSGHDDSHRAAIDPLAVLAPVENQPMSWLSPGPISLELGGAGVESPGGSRPIEVALVDHHGTQVRAVVRLPHARFSLWSDRGRLFGVLKHDLKLANVPGANPMSEMFVMLRAGARVKRLARNGKTKQTQIRFVGALEVEGWIADDNLSDAGPGGTRAGRMHSGRRPAMMFPGSIIRTEPRWGTNTLAVVNTAHMLDTIQEMNDGWIEVTYADGDVQVHGYTSKRQPPGAVHRQKDPDVPPPVITPNAKVPSGTCLYSKRNGDRIGYIVGEIDVQLDDLGSGWWTLAVDTPWGPIPFAAKGPKDALTPCAPAGSVPATP
jgi:hypothetical protein